MLVCLYSLTFAPAPYFNTACFSRSAALIAGPEIVVESFAGAAEMAVLVGMFVGAFVVGAFVVGAFVVGSFVVGAFVVGAFVVDKGALHDDDDDASAGAFVG